MHHPPTSSTSWAVTSYVPFMQVRCAVCAVCPCCCQVRLFEEEPSYCSYGEAYDINCARFGREPDMPIVHFKKRLATPEGSYAPVCTACTQPRPCGTQEHV